MPFCSVVRWRLTHTLWLVAALLWTPFWGQWHGIVHPVQPTVFASVTTQSLSESPAPRAKAQDHGHEQGSTLCQVLDHLGCASALPSWALTFNPALVLLALPLHRWRDGLGQPIWWPAQARAPPHRM